MTWGPPVLEWAYAQAESTGVDSFLMGPSGYGYLFPGNMTRQQDKVTFAKATVTAADALDMEAYVHWDVDVFLDNRTTNRTKSYMGLFNDTAVRGAFLLGSDPLDGKWPEDHSTAAEMVGSLAVINPIYQYGPANASLACAAINKLAPGAIVYVYLGLGYDPGLVDEIAAGTKQDVEFLGHRELISMAHQAHHAQQMNSIRH